ncbi:MAG TPA: hypothetical protein VN898_09975, partial [Candidatus Binatia bacterium]|nr:hypothetical protein [Candidatus Binatia bacterium]
MAGSQWSIVQASPSVQSAPTVSCTQAPVARSQVSIVQALPSMQLTGAAGRQTPFWQKSPVVQEFPSLQGPVMTVWKQPVDATHPSVVQGFPSSQLVVDPGVHVPLTQRSP